MCTCIAGNGGKYCKDIAVIELFYPQSVTRQKMISSEERYELAVLAVGELNAPARSLFGLPDTEPSMNYIEDTAEKFPLYLLCSAYS